MTTIAYRDGVLASDSQMSTERGKVGQVAKLACNEELQLYAGWCGEAPRMFGAMGFFEDAEGGEVIEGLIEMLGKNSELLLIDRKQQIWILGQGGIIKLRDKYFAVGSGSMIALAAMDAGASAVDAIKIAKKRDLFTGGRIQTLNTRG